MIGILACLLAGVGAFVLWQPPRPRSLPLRLWAGCLVAALATGGVAHIVVGVPAVVAAGALAGGCAPYAWRRRSRAAQVRRRAEAWPDAVDVIRSAVRAGATLPEAVADCGGRVPEALAGRFRAVQTRRAVGESFPRAVQSLVVAGDPVGSQVAAVLVLADEIGSADTGRVLGSFAEFLRADVAQQREIAARHSWNVAAARVAVLAPWLTVAALSVQPAGRAAYSTPTGTALLAAVALLTGGAYFAMSRIGRAHSAVPGQS